MQCRVVNSYWFLAVLAASAFRFVVVPAGAAFKINIVEKLFSFLFRAIVYDCKYGPTTCTMHSDPKR